MELRVGCRRPPEEPVPGLPRYRVASKVVKASRWAAPTMSTFIGQLGSTRKTERARLQADHDRAVRVVAEIDAARTTMNEDSA
ncbi:hypothetical protein ACFWWM_42350 [Streptomyces sp. NPDC058682]|uniref:hypothetical protein n=1 Tax=unclassified Streptomyces TaxID=2593676 RepID=UPI0022579F54|nr:hypothetical protein [Streptomyces sp. NBC_01214]MCX4808614.1 hypothetical protein [Streptomyces sp. NBC_01214]